MSTYLQRNHNINLEKTGILSRLMSLVFKRKKNKKVNVDPEEAELLESLNKAREEWIAACMDFEYADNNDIVDYHTYKIKAYQLKYEYYLKKAKQKGIKVNMLNVLETPETPAEITRLKM